MIPYVEEALAVDPDRQNYQSIRECAGEYHSQIMDIILHYSCLREFSAVWIVTLNALPPARRLLFVYMDWIYDILNEGLKTALLNADGREIRLLREMVELSQSSFLKEKVDEALALFTKTFEPQENENFWSYHTHEETTEYFDENDMARIEEIGEEIDNWDPVDIDTAFRRLSESTP